MSDDLNLIVKGSDIYFYKNSYKQSQWDRVQLRLPNVKKTISSIDLQKYNNVTTKQAYTSKTAIPEMKKESLQSLLRGNLIPKYYGNYYSTLF